MALEKSAPWLSVGYLRSGKMDHFTKYVYFFLYGDSTTTLDIALYLNHAPSFERSK